MTGTLRRGRISCGETKIVLGTAGAGKSVLLKNNQEAKFSTVLLPIEPCAISSMPAEME